MLQHLILGAFSQRLQRGKAAHKAFEIGDHRADLGLLQHDLGHPYPVGADVLLPGQVLAAELVIPVQHPGPQAVCVLYKI